MSERACKYKNVGEFRKMELFPLYIDSIDLGFGSQCYNHVMGAMRRLTE
jgi:hypothetical protein